MLSSPLYWANWALDMWITSLGGAELGFKPRPAWPKAWVHKHVPFCHQHASSQLSEGRILRPVYCGENWGSEREMDSSMVAQPINGFEPMSDQYSMVGFSINSWSLGTHGLACLYICGAQARYQFRTLALPPSLRTCASYGTWRYVWTPQPTSKPRQPPLPPGYLLCVAEGLG